MAIPAPINPTSISFTRRFVPPQVLKITAPMTPPIPAAEKIAPKTWELLPERANIIELKIAAPKLLANQNEAVIISKGRKLELCQI
ncbi:hypothetical protein H1P_3150001 [Hyella patelloides LEGE 07179]|uniref:Uncharacterized protein n=1 Tax=Hyella patelloides LEGE 07179 TaxID=945734 RepID=A0A563VUT4_9CYAN|nr:hypothetical protein H1P_3150001 [Hyella patelloides LEGE 07179]